MPRKVLIKKTHTRNSRVISDWFLRLLLIFSKHNISSESDSFQIQAIHCNLSIFLVIPLTQYIIALVVASEFGDIVLGLMATVIIVSYFYST